VNLAARIKDAARIVDIIGEAVELRRKGNSLWGRCPFHHEKTASFSVDENRNRFKCFGCGQGGDAIDFAQKFHGLDFRDALRLLAERYGITTEDDAEDQGYRDRSRLRALYAAMQAAYSRALPGSAAASYLIRRGIPLKIAEEFGLGFAHDELPRGVTPKQGDGILAKSGRPLIRSRLTVPIQSTTGDVIAFAGRALTDLQEPKYLNSPETAIYSKRSTLYNLHRAGNAGRKAGRMVVTEGYFDVIASHRAGIAETVAICGTALSDEHAKLISRHVGLAVLAFDGDKAGIAALEKAAPPLLKAGLEIRVCRLPKGQDVADLCRSEPDKYLAALAYAQDLWAFLLAQLAAEHDLRSPLGASKAIAAIRPFAAVLGAVERSALAAEVSSRTGAAQAVVDAALAGRGGPEPVKAKAVGYLPGEVTLIRLFADEPRARAILPDAVLLFERLGLSTAPILSVLAESPSIDYDEWELRSGEAAQDLAALVMAEGPRPSIADGAAALGALKRELRRRERAEALRAAQGADDAAAMEALARLSKSA